MSLHGNADCSVLSPWQQYKWIWSKLNISLTCERSNEAAHCLWDTAVTQYRSSKKPDMSVAATYNGKMSEEHINLQEISVARAHYNDFQFVKDILSKVGTTEYNGYNTCICHETGMKPSKKSVHCYLPLMNITPTDPTTASLEDLRWPKMPIKTFLL